VDAQAEIPYLRRVWEGIEPAVTAIIQDVIQFLFLFGALAIAYLVLELMASLGYPYGRVETMETMGYYAYLAALVIFLFDLLFKVGSHVLRRK
jgi:hypothetical protein